MQAWLNGLKRVIMRLGVVALVLAPLEQVLPDECDGHLGLAASELGASNGETAPWGHLPSTPHTCHGLHGHSVFLRAADPLAIPVRITNDFKPQVMPQPPALRDHDTFRPPIA